MRAGVPLEVTRGYCFVRTEYAQRGSQVDPSDTLKRLARYKQIKPIVSKGNALAVGSIGATIVGTTTFLIGILGSGNGGIKMSDGTSTALIATGATAAALSWVLCIAADGTYASAAEVYNQQLAHGGAPSDGDDDDAANETASRNQKPNAAPAVREPGDDGNYGPPPSDENPRDKAPRKDAPVKSNDPP